MFSHGKVELFEGERRTWEEKASEEIELETDCGIQFLEEEHWPNTAENNAEILRRMRAFEPGAMTPAKRAEWEADLKLSDQISIADNLKQDFMP